jgi:hypothetical protein
VAHNGQVLQPGVSEVQPPNTEVESQFADGHVVVSHAELM